MEKIIKKRVTDLLREQGKTQKGMANDLYISAEHLSRCLSNGEISKTWLIAIADYLDCSPDWLSNENAADLNSYGYRRGEVIKNQHEIMTNLFVLLGWQPDDYAGLPENQKNSLKNDIDLIIAAYKGRNATMVRIAAEGAQDDGND